jgi:GT2 family glycosyltransferase
MDVPEVVHKADTPRRSEAEQVAFFERVLGQALLAEERVGAIEYFLDIAGATVRLRFAGDGLARHLSGALAHLFVAPVEHPDASFHIWDSETTAVTMPPPPCKPDCFTDRGDLWGLDSPRIRSAFHWIECSVNLFDAKTTTGVFWVETARTLPYWTKASPLRSLFHWWMEARGGQLLHAAAIGTEAGGVLVTGKGGVGKSTTALSCLAAGLRYVGDDYVVVELDPVPRAWSLYGTAKLNADQLERFPGFRDLVSNLPFLEREKAVMYLYPEFSELIARSLPLAAVLTPRIQEQRATEIRATDQASLQRAAAFTTMSQLPHAGRRTHEFIVRLIGALPGFELALGSERADIPRAIADLLASSRERMTALARRCGVAPLRPLVSVIVPVYNGARFLAGAIDNILRQNYSALEITVVDDGSTDDIDRAVAALPIDVRYFKQENAGAASARNRGIRDASGEFIAFLDVDDLWPADNLTCLAEVLAGRPELDIVRGYAQIVQNDAATGQLDYIGNPGESFPYYLGAALYRRRAFEKIGLFDTELRFAEDTDWYNRAGEVGIAMVRLDQVTLLARRHDANMTRGKSLVELNALRVFKKALDRKRAISASPDSAR